MLLRRALILSIVLLGATATEGAAQSPGAALPDALASLVGGPGGCFGDLTPVDTTVAFFPGVRFARAYCSAEHGDSISAVVALDSDSVLYLLGSEDAFNFLVHRHHPVGLDSTSALAYARLGLEFTGHATGYASVVTSWTGIPAAARAGLNVGHDKWLYIYHPDPRSGWDVHFGRIEHGYDGPYYYSNYVSIERDGKIFLAKDSLVYSPNRSR